MRKVSDYLGYNDKVIVKIPLDKLEKIASELGIYPRGDLDADRAKEALDKINNLQHQESRGICS